MKNIYTIGEEGDRLIGKKISGISGPNNEEVCMLLFTEPWMAAQYLRYDLKNNTAGVYEINSSESWEYYKDLMIDIFNTRNALIDPCSSTCPQPFGYQFLLLESANDFFKVSDAIRKDLPCINCYRKDQFLEKNGPLEKIKIFSLKFN